MIKSKFNSKLREYAKTLSPKQHEQDLVNAIYESFNDLFGVNNCIQIGSYPRSTAVTPVHDLDILYILGSWDENNHTPSTTLRNLYDQINNSYVNPAGYIRKVSLQTHSVTVEFWESSAMFLSVDIVPAYTYGENEYNQDTYKVPEVIKERDHILRKALTWDASDNSLWINSDPRGYIKVASEVGQNSDFRKAVKFVKRWKNNLCDADNNLKLKSFHLEQVVTKIFQRDQDIDIFDAVFSFFCDLPDIIKTPNQIADRANRTKHIDNYLAEFTKEQIEKIIKARDGFLTKLENLEESGQTSSLMEISFHARSPSEEFMFDRKIASFIDPQHLDFALSAYVTDKQGNEQRRLNTQGVIDSNRYLIFKRSKHVDGCQYYWKVKNDNRSKQPRGEITAHSTKNIPEVTKYRGTHYVECYAIKNDVCVASAKHYVVLV